MVIPEDTKKDHHPFDGPAKLVEELEKNSEWNLVKLHNFRILKDKPSSTGITIINKR